MPDAGAQRACYSHGMASPIATAPCNPAVCLFAAREIRNPLTQVGPRTRAESVVSAYSEHHALLSRRFPDDRGAGLRRPVAGARNREREEPERSDADLFALAASLRLTQLPLTASKARGPRMRGQALHQVERARRWHNCPIAKADPVPCRHGRRPLNRCPLNRCSVSALTRSAPTGAGPH